MSQDLVRYRCRERDCSHVFYTPFERVASSCPYCLGDIKREDDKGFQSSLVLRRKSPSERFKRSITPEIEEE